MTGRRESGQDRKEMKMEFIQKKSADRAVEYFLPKAADKEISLAWDRYEGQLPECGFCESGLSCRDCLQGPCISHPFRDSSKLGVCGKDKDILALQSLLRLVLKGSMACLDQVGELAAGADAAKAGAVFKQAQELVVSGGAKLAKDFPKELVDAWQSKGVWPEGVARDIFKASQKTEGGISSPEEVLLWTVKAALLGCLAKRIQGKLKQALFGNTKPTKVDVNMGVLKKDAPNVLFYGQFSPVLKQKISQAARKKKINVAGVCSDPLLPPEVIPPATTYGSQEIPLMSGAVDLIVAGDQFVNPSLADIAKDWRIPIICTEKLNPNADLDAFAKEIVAQAQKSYDTRGDIARDVPDTLATATLGYAVKAADIKKIIEALKGGKIKGIVILSGSNNVKFTQDGEFASMVRHFLAKDLLCISEGEASIVLAKHGFLDPKAEDIECGPGVAGLCRALSTPAVVDCDVTDFLLALAKTAKKPLKDLPLFACFSEANRSEEVVKAVALMAMGVSTYFWPSLPVTGSSRALKVLTDYCVETFGAGLNVVVKKLSAAEKAKLIIGRVAAPASMSGKSWE